MAPCRGSKPFTVRLSGLHLDGTLDGTRKIQKLQTQYPRARWASRGDASLFLPSSPIR
jgi:hypothetical protein